MDLENIFFVLISLPFLIINIGILYSDGKKKIIPNKYLKYLLFLLIFWYIYLFSFGIIGWNLHILMFLFQIFFTFLVSFALYHFGLWSAGDAKYLLVLSLYIPQIGIIPFMGNISLITLLYLIIYFFYFYTWKSYKQRSSLGSLFEYIKKDNRDKFYAYLDTDSKKGDKKLYIIGKVLNFILTFFLFFIIIRLLRFGFFEYISTDLFNEKIFIFIQNYSTYIFIFGILLFLGFLYTTKYLFQKWIPFLSRKLGFQIKNIHLGIKIISFTFLISYIFGEYMSNPQEILHKLFLIFTLYLGLFIIVKILWYSYKLAFQVGEHIDVTPNMLKKGHILDKQYFLQNYFISEEKIQLVEKNTQFSQEFLDFSHNLSNKDYFKKIANPLDEESIEKIQIIVYFRNMYYKQQKIKTEFSQLYNIKILKTFAFASYIFGGFILTYAYGNDIFSFIFTSIFDLIFHL